MPWEFLTGLKNVLPQFGEKWQVLERKTTHIKKLCRVISSDSENVKLCWALQEFLFIFIDRQFLIRFLFRRGNILVLLLSEKKLGGLYFLSNWLAQRKLGLFWNLKIAELWKALAQNWEGIWKKTIVTAPQLCLFCSQTELEHYISKGKKKFLQRLGLPFGGVGNLFFSCFW